MFRWGSGRMKAGIARASRSDVRSDWSITFGANFTYQLYLQCPGRGVCTLYTSLPALPTVKRSSPTFPRLQRLSV